MGQHAAPQVFGELALDVTGQSATFGVGRSYLGEHRLRVPRDELVQHCALGLTTLVTGEGCPSAPDVRSYRPPASVYAHVRADNFTEHDYRPMFGLAAADVATARARRRRG